MLSQMGMKFSRIFRRIVPHTMVLAVLLTIATAGLCLWQTPVTAHELLMIWGGQGTHPLLRIHQGHVLPGVIQKIEPVGTQSFRVSLWSKTPYAQVVEKLRQHPSKFQTQWKPGQNVVTISGVSLSQLQQDLALLRVPARIKGIWQFLSFSMQMCLILLAGYTVAVSSSIQRLIRYVAAIPKDAGSAAAWVAFVAMLTGWLNWGLGLIVGAYFAREVGKQGELRGIPMHYPLLGAAGYTSLLIWHCGLSGSAPLKVAEVGHLSQELGLAMPPIPLSATIFSPMNLAISLSLLFAVPLLLRAMAPNQARDMYPFSYFSPLQDAPAKSEPADPENNWLENWRGVNFILAFCILAFLFFVVRQSGFNLSINAVILFVLAIGLLCYRSIREYVVQASKGGASCVSIMLQFPLYAGIYAMLYESGMTDHMASWGQSITSPSLFLMVNFLISGLVNIFIPSGGGQWGVQGSIVLTAAQQLNISPGAAVMTVAYGDQWTNMLQPFWALALLEITGLRARDILGYTILLLFATGFLFLLALGLFGSLS